MSIIAVFNQKGGVGKTTTTLNLAAAFARMGRTPYSIDLDPQAQLTNIAGVSTPSGDDTIFSMFHRNRPLRELVRQSPCGINVIPSHVELSKVDALFGKGYNAVNRLNTALQAENFGSKESPLIIDCGPNIGVLSLNAIFSCDCLIVPMSADYLSAQGASQVKKTLSALQPVLKRDIKRRYLLTRFDTRRGMAWEVLRTAEEEFGADICSTYISENVSLAESPGHNKTVYQYAPDSRGAHDHSKLLTELLVDGFIE